MAQAQTKPSPSPLAFSNQKSFSNNIHKRVLKAIQEIIESFDKFDVKDDENEKYFFNEVNHFYHDLATNIFHLRKTMIMIGRKDQSAQDLKDVVESLNKLASSTQESLNLHADELKNKLKHDIVEIGALIEQLMKIIEFDELHEFKQRVLDCQHDLVLCVEKLKLYNMFRYLSIADLEGQMHEIMDKIKNNLIIIKTGHQLLEEDFSHYIRHSVQIMQNALDYMRRNRNIENLKGDFRKAFQKAEEFSSSFIEEVLEAIRYDNPMNKMLDVIESCHRNITLGSSELNQLKGLLTNKPDDKEMEILKYLIPHSFIGGLSGMHCLNQSIEDAIIKIGKGKEIGI